MNQFNKYIGSIDKIGHSSDVDIDMCIYSSQQGNVFDQNSLIINLLTYYQKFTNQKAESTDNQEDETCMDLSDTAAFIKYLDFFHS